MSTHMTGPNSIVEKLLETTDAQEWAKAFVRIVNGNKDKIVIDEGLMISWFASVIETTPRITERKYEVDPLEHPFQRVAKKKFEDRTNADKAVLTAILLLSMRGDFHLPNEKGQDVVCSSLTMEDIFDLLVFKHDKILGCAR